jgi:hypothetical protein
MNSLQAVRKVFRWIDEREAEDGTIKWPPIDAIVFIHKENARLQKAIHAKEIQAQKDLMEIEALKAKVSRMRAEMIKKNEIYYAAMNVPVCARLMEEHGLMKRELEYVVAWCHQDEGELDADRVKKVLAKVLRKRNGRPGN